MMRLAQTQARLLGQLRQRERRERRLFRGLEDDRAAGRERRGHLAGHHRRGEVPGRHGKDDADRLLDDQNPPVRSVGGDDVAVEASGFFGVPLDVGRTEEDLAPRLREGLALLHDHQRRQGVDVGDDQVVPGPQDRPTLPGGASPPGQGAFGGLDGLQGVLGRKVGDGAEHGGGRRIANLEAPPRRGADPGPVDIGVIDHQAARARPF